MRISPTGGGWGRVFSPTRRGGGLRRQVLYVNVLGSENLARWHSVNAHCYQKYLINSILQVKG